MNVEIRDTPALRLATLRHVGPYNRISEAFARLGTLVNDGELPRSADAMLAVFYDDPETTPALELRSDAALAIPEGVQIPAGLEEQRLPAGRCAVHRHVGPYEELGDVWARLMGEWLPQSGHRVKDAPAYEIYRNTPADVPKQQLVTELCVPLAS